MKSTFYGKETSDMATIPDENEIREILKDILEAIDEKAGEELLKRMIVRVYRRGEIIFNEEKTPRQMFCLAKGKVKIYKNGIGRSQTINILSSVSYFGFRAAIAEGKYLTSAAALEDSLIIKFPMPLMKEYARTYPRMTYLFLKQLSILLGKAAERTVTLTQKHLRARLADSMLYLLDCYGTQSDGHTLACSISREDLANLSNMTTNNAIRTLSQFASENLVTLNKRSIRIENIEALQRISQLG
ncbi:MAG: Crp/Fnr family transcriptional regulator [Bacteroidaceae bacterium]|nr:Crp/Fnr family transcriptional regulator [Bacteroidaceae bacterium]